jgi:FkbM family methyltransferase
MIRMPRMPRSMGARAYFAAGLVPWRPVFRVRSPRSGLSLFVHRKDVIGRHVAKYGEYEPALTRWIDERLRGAPPGLFIDVGANVGWHTLHAARHASVETVLVFEPDLFNAYLLDRNICENGIGNVVVSTCAIGSRPRTARLYRYKSSNLGRHSLLQDYGRGFRAVPQLDLDAAVRDLGFDDRPINILKIDVEGYEPDVIAGAGSTLERTEVVIHEFSPAFSWAGGLSAADILTRLDAGGFLPYAFGPACAFDKDGARGARDFSGTRRSRLDQGEMLACEPAIRHRSADSHPD